MATKEEKLSSCWVTPELELTEEFENQSFEKLTEYSNENMLNLMSIWLNSELSEVKRILMLGTAKLSHFEKSIEVDQEYQAIFNLGKLLGHLECLNMLDYERDQNALAKAKMASIKVLHPEYNSKYFDDIVLMIADKGRANEKQLAKKLQFKLVTVRKILNILCDSNLVLCYKNPLEREYILSDMGIRLVKQLNKEGKF